MKDYFPECWRNVTRMIIYVLSLANNCKTNMYMMYFRAMRMKNLVHKAIHKSELYLLYRSVSVCTTIKNGHFQL